MTDAASLHSSLFRCLACGSNGLTLTDNALSCAACGAEFPIRDGLPRFVPETNYADSFGFQWNSHRLTQLDSHSGIPISRQRLFQTTGWSTDLAGQTILEAGSGAGRFTEVLLATGANVFSFDYSSAVDANFANNGGHANLCLFQGDIFDIPLRLETFDKVICLGVLQHTPDPERAFRSLVRHVRPGGQIVIDVYARRLTAVLSWKYLLRPITKRMAKRRLYRLVEQMVDMLLPTAVLLRRLGGRLGARLMPIVEYSHLGLPADLNREWTVLDTFDMYSPAHDHPRSLVDLRRWFSECGLVDVVVQDGPNGVIGRGRVPPVKP